MFAASSGVGEQDDDFRSRLGIAKHVDPDGEAGADRRATGERAGVDRRDEPLRCRVIERRRAQDDGFAAEDDYPHAVVGKAAEEVVDDALGRVDLGRTAQASFGHGA